MNGIQKKHAICEADMKWQAGWRVGSSKKRPQEKVVTGWR
jgi:hypothetical protein